MFGRSKAKKNAKVYTKEAKKINATADAMVEANEQMAEARQLKKDGKQKLNAAIWHANNLKLSDMRDNITDMRVKLYIQKEKMCRRVINANKERQYIMDNENEFGRGTKYQKEIERCQREAKCSYYVLDFVMTWIDKIDNIEDDLDWQMTLKDLSASYEMMHNILKDEDDGLLAKIAFFINNFMLKNKGKIDFGETEEEFYKTINQLLTEIKTEKQCNNFNINSHVNDNVYPLITEEDVYKHIEWGLCEGDEEEENIDIKRNYSDSKYSSSSGETEKNDDNSENKSGMTETPKEENKTPENIDETPAKSEESPQQNEEISDNSAVNSELSEDEQYIADNRKNQGLLSLKT